MHIHPRCYFVVTMRFRQKNWETTHFFYLTLLNQNQTVIVQDKRKDIVSVMSVNKLNLILDIVGSGVNWQIRRMYECGCCTSISE